MTPKKHEDYMNTVAVVQNSVRGTNINVNGCGYSSICVGFNDDVVLRLLDIIDSQRRTIEKMAEIMANYGK